MAAACTGSHGDPGDPGALNRAAPAQAAQPLKVIASWTAYQLPQPVSGQAAVAQNGQIVLAGGAARGKPLRSITRLSPRTGQVRPAGTLATPAANAAAAFVGGRLTVFGGADGRSIPAVQSVPPVQAPRQRGGQAVVRARLPEPRSGLAVVSLHGTTYLVGGGSPGRLAPAVLRTTDGAHYAVVAKLPARSPSPGRSRPRDICGSSAAWPLPG